MQISIFGKRLIFPRWESNHLSQSMWCMMNIYIYCCMFTSKELNFTKRCLSLYLLVPLGALWWSTWKLYAYSSCWAIGEEIVSGGLSGRALTWTMRGVGLSPTWGKSIFPKMDVWWIFRFNNNWICIVALTGYAIPKLLNIIITPAQAKHCDIP